MKLLDTNSFELLAQEYWSGPLIRPGGYQAVAIGFLLTLSCLVCCLRFCVCMTGLLNQRNKKSLELLSLMSFLGHSKISKV